ncbi:MAG: YIP1 family protein [Candidatus Altiarchaeota archaeon]|nr:YIP1 family protein [Candidatus Altiarchaeota archaeon]
MMSFFKSLKQAVRILKLDEKAISEVASNQNSTIYALIIILITAFASGVAFDKRIDADNAIINPLLYVVYIVVIVGILHLLARIASGKGQYIDLFRVIGLLFITNWVDIMVGIAVYYMGILVHMPPVESQRLMIKVGSIITIPVSVWKTVVSIIVVKSIYKLSSIRAVLVVVLPIITILGVILLPMLLYLICVFVPGCAQQLSW